MCVCVVNRLQRSQRAHISTVELTTTRRYFAYVVSFSGKKETKWKTKTLRFCPQHPASTPAVCSADTATRWCRRPASRESPCCDYWDRPTSRRSPSARSGCWHSCWTRCCSPGPRARCSITTVQSGNNRRTAVNLLPLYRGIRRRYVVEHNIIIYQEQRGNPEVITQRQRLITGQFWPYICLPKVRNKRLQTLRTSIAVCAFAVCQVWKTEATDIMVYCYLQCFTFCLFSFFFFFVALLNSLKIFEFK